MKLIRGCLITLAAWLALVVSTQAQPVGQPQTITVIDSGTACVTAPTACATFALDNQTASISLSISGTWTGTLTFEGTNNGGIWTPVAATNRELSTSVTTTTAGGLFAIQNAGLVKVRVRATATITGSALVTAAKGLGGGGNNAGGGGASGGWTDSGALVSLTTGTDLIGSNLRPTDASYTLGDASHQWLAAYVSNDGDGIVFPNMAMYSYNAAEAEIDGGAGYVYFDGSATVALSGLESGAAQFDETVSVADTLTIGVASNRRLSFIPIDPSAALFGATVGDFANVGGDSGGRHNTKLSWGYNPGAENSIPPTSAEHDVSWNVETFYNPSAGLAQQEQYFIMGASHYRWLMLEYRTIGSNETTGVPSVQVNLPIIHFTNQDLTTDYATLSTAGLLLASGPLMVPVGIAGYGGGKRTFLSDTGGFTTQWMVDSPGAANWQMQYESGVGTKVNTPTGEGIQFKINDVVKAAMTSDGKFGGLLLTTPVTAASSGTRYLCISTTGAVTSSATACSGT